MYMHMQDISLTKLFNLREFVADPDKAQEAGVKTNDPWWVIVLKVVAYLIGLLLGGTLTTSCVSHML